MVSERVGVGVEAEAEAEGKMELDRGIDIYYYQYISFYYCLDCILPELNFKTAGIHYFFDIFLKKIIIIILFGLYSSRLTCDGDCIYSCENDYLSWTYAH